MKSIEMGGIRLARGWNVASLNEFRGYFGLKPHDSFRSISTIPGVAQSLQALYGHPDNVELYPGLVAEDAKDPEAPGSGLCPGMTIGTAILADAVNLVRGDRFYTVVCGAMWILFHANTDFYRTSQPPILQIGGSHKCSLTPMLLVVA